MPKYYVKERMQPQYGAIVTHFGTVGAIGTAILHSEGDQHP